MTKDEVMAMTDKELQIKAAELAGWMRRKEPMKVPYMWAPGHFAEEPMDLWWDNPQGEPDVEPPDCPNDIIAALELWEQVPLPKEIWWEDDEGSIIINVYCGPIDELGFAYCLSGKQEELPRLITRASILTVGGKHE